MATKSSNADAWLQELDLFHEPEHQAYLWEHAETDPAQDTHPAALLIHGFPGTPMETRPLGTHLHARGWSVSAPLLPGFGPEIDTLFERDHEEWIAEAQTALRQLQAHHDPVLVIGHSMGGAIALTVAANHKPHGVALLAPFWRLPFSSPWLRLLSPILRLFIRRTRPFQTLDLSSSEMQDDIDAYLPDVDLDDPEVREQIRNFTVPTRLFEQLERLGTKAYEAASRINAPTLIVQGIEDELVSRSLTRKLMTRISGPVEYCEIHAEHNLLMTEAPGWHRVKTHVQAFANRLNDRAERNDI